MIERKVRERKAGEDSKEAGRGGIGEIRREKKRREVVKAEKRNRE